MYKLWIWVFLAAASGILLAKYSDATLLLPAMFPFIAVWFYRRELAKIIITACCVMIFAFCYYELAVPPRPAGLNELRGVQLSGQIAEFPEQRAGRTVIVIAADADDPLMRKFRVSLYFRGDFVRGQQVTIKADLRPVPGPRNPGAFDYAEYMAGEGIYYLGSADSPGDVQITGEPGIYDAFVNSCRNSALSAIKGALPEEEAAVLIGMLLNDVTMMEPGDYELYQKTGIVHLFSVSGLHTGFLILMMAWLGDLMRLRARGRFLGTMAVLLVYASMTGWPVAVQRSVLMAFLCLLAHYAGRSHQLINGLCLSAVLILASNPQALFNLSFQLTFIATLGLVALFPALRGRLITAVTPQAQERTVPAARLGGRREPGSASAPLLQRWSFLLLEAVLLPFSAELAIIPLIAYHFNMVSPWSWLTNILTAYTSGLAVILGFAALLVAPVSQDLAGFFLQPAGLMVELIEWPVSMVAGLPWACLWVRSPSAGLLGAFYIGIALFYTALYRDWRLRGLIPGVLLIVLAMVLTVWPPACLDPADGLLKIVFVDVGQGDCIYIHTPKGRHLLIDGGGSEFYDVGRLTVAPFLKQEGVRKLDWIFNTHPDIDHVAGLQAVFANFTVDCLAVPECLAGNPAYADLTHSSGGRFPVDGVQKLHAGQKICLEEGLELRVLSPEAGSECAGETGSQSQNASSLVMELRYGRFGLLLSGDIDAAGMDRLAAGSWLQPCTVVKVPHHGSRNSLSCTFYRALRPVCAIIQSGQGNPFGHPSQPHLDLLNQQGITVLRSDQEGAITMLTNGSALEIKSFLRRE